MGEIERKRAQLRLVYKTKSWQEKVDKMHDAQVIAIHKRFSAKNMFQKPPYNS